MAGQYMRAPPATRPIRLHAAAAPASLGAVIVALLLAALPARAADEAEAIRALLVRGDATSALERAERAAAAAPREPQWVFLRGVALMDLRRDAEALVLFERMTEEYPELADPWNNIALLQVRAGRLDAARGALETALRHDPAHRTARANLGLVHLMLAAQLWEALAASGPVDPQLVRRLQGVRALLGTPGAGASATAAPAPAAGPPAAAVATGR